MGYSNKYLNWSNKIEAKLVRLGLVLIEEGTPAISTEEASTGSVYMRINLKNGRTFNLRLADHRMGCMGACDFWAEKYNDAVLAVLAAAK